jgi:hypothetical protein
VRPVLDVRHPPNASRLLRDADQHPNVILTPPRPPIGGLERRSGTGSGPHPAATPSDCPSGRPRALEAELTAAKMKDCRWLKLMLVGQFEFLEWTGENHLGGGLAEVDEFSVCRRVLAV